MLSRAAGRDAVEEAVEKADEGRQVNADDASGLRPDMAAMRRWPNAILNAFIVDYAG